MSAPDRQSLLQVLGFGSVFKVLSDPYPLGGYSGLEVGLTQEVIATTKIESLGNRAPRQNDLALTSLSLSKGLYNNLDVGIQVVLPRQTEEVSGWGAMFRMGVFESGVRPLNVSVLLHGNSVNFQDRLLTNTQGLLTLAAYNVEELTLYTGFGFVRSQGNFLGGVNGLTDEVESLAGTDSSGRAFRKTMKESLSDNHLIAGAHFKMDRFFVALQIDRIVQTSFGIKMGLRYD